MIEMDNVRYFPVMKGLGEAMVDFIVDRAAKKEIAPFSDDLVADDGSDELVTREGDTTRILKQMSDPDWLDKQEA